MLHRVREVCAGGEFTLSQQVEIDETYIGGKESNKHLARYVNEASFRLNEGNCGVDTIDRMEALVRQTAGRRISREALTPDNGDNGMLAEVQRA